MPNHRCDHMKRALEMELFEENLLNPSQVFVRQPKKLQDGTKGNRLVLLNNCPFCGDSMFSKLEAITDVHGDEK